MKDTLIATGISISLTTIVVALLMFFAWASHPSNNLTQAQMDCETDIECEVAYGK